MITTRQVTDDSYDYLFISELPNGELNVIVEVGSKILVNTITPREFSGVHSMLSGSDHVRMRFSYGREFIDVDLAECDRVVVQTAIECAAD